MNSYFLLAIDIPRRPALCRPDPRLTLAQSAVTRPRAGEEGVEIMSKNSKKKPTGNYPIGYAKPPRMAGGNLVSQAIQKGDRLCQETHLRTPISSSMK